MKEQPLGAPRTVSSSRQRVGAFVSSRHNNMFGVTEIVALSISCLIFLMVLFSYLYFLLPARARLTTLKSDRAQLQANLQRSENIVNRDRGIQQTVDKIAASLDRFESSGLVGSEQGRMDLYEDLNRLIVKNALRNTSGPTYTALEPAGSKGTGKTTSTRWQSVYPGVAVDVTVEGPYQNVRKFIRDLESSKQFVIINQVELQQATENTSTADVGTETSSGSRASLVSLQLNMATYFQRAGARQD